MLRCRENDLAVILRGPYAGYFVTVGKFIGTEYLLSANRVLTTQDNLWEIKNDDISADFPGKAVRAPDDYLQPIRPGRTPVTTETERRITA
jgi:hypothetical protein